MNDQDPRNEAGNIAIPIVIALLGIAGSGFLYFQLTTTRTELSTALAKETSLSDELRTMVVAKEEENRQLSEALYSAQQKNESLEDDLNDIQRTVGRLEKLSKIDPELLQKYSKVFFLNEHYAPASLAEIDAKYRFPEDKELTVQKRVWPFLESLLKEARSDKIDLRVASAYRSFGDQTSLKSQYSVVYGAGSANQFSADQGYSEHQLGTTVDFTTASSSGALDGFDTKPAYAWLVANAYKYGFVLSYPKGNAYYVFEPWHWRFVGVDLAEDLHKQKIGFYDMDQREIDKYLIRIFDR